MTTPEIETLLTPTDADQLLYESEGYRVLHVNPQGSAIGQGVLITRHDDGVIAFVGGPSGADHCLLIVHALQSFAHFTERGDDTQALIEPIESWLDKFVTKYRPVVRPNDQKWACCTSSIGPDCAHKTVPK